MHQIAERIYNLSAYALAGVGMAVNFENIKGVILFTGAVTLLVLQIRIHIIKLQKELKNKDKSYD